MVVVIGFEGSANKIGVGIIRDGVVLSNPRKTFISPPGKGFMPSETARHHQEHVLEVTRQALEEAKLKRMQGFLNYMVDALRTMFLYYHAPQVRIEIENETNFLQF